MAEQKQDDPVMLPATNTPSYYVDGPVGSAWANGVHRVLLGEFVPNPTAGATKPFVRPSVTIMMTQETAKRLVEALQALIADQEQ